MNALPHRIFAPIAAVPHEHIDLSFAQACQRGLQRTLQALFRERLLNQDQLIVEGAISWLPLWSRQSMLRFEGLHIGRIGNCELTGQVSCYQTGERPRALSSSSALIAFVADALPHAVATKNIGRLIRELDNSTENDALCLRYRRQWANELNSAIRTSGQPSLIAMLMNASPEQWHNPALLLEQWGTLGHPWHPGYKTKLGLTPQEVKAMSPEFQANLTLSLAALKADKAHVAMTGDDGNYRTWFAKIFPEHLLMWEAALRQRHQDPGAWLPLPIHPYQATVLPEKFAAEIASGDLLLLPEVQMNATPTMSFRTVVPNGASNLPHIKLPVSLYLTSAQRTVSPKSAAMGPRLTQLLSRIVADEGGFGGTLDFLGEGVGVHFIDPDGNDDRSRHLSVLFRCNPMSKRQASLFPIPAGALFADTPVDGRALVTELVALSYGDHAHGALQFYKQYADTLITAVLGPYLLYGIAFEAHQQNSFIMVDQDCRPVQLLVRDFGDLRVHGPSLQRAALALDVFRKGHTVFELNEPVRDKLLHSVMLCHLSELALLLARSYRHPEAAFWRVLQTSTVDAFERLRNRTDPQRWESERVAVLEAKWPAKALLRMRLCDTSDDVHGEVANPLAGAGR